MTTEFDKLLGDLDNILAKAQPVATDEDQDDKQDGQTKAAPAAGEADDADGDDMMKSFRVTLDDGREVEAYDATAMMKSMHTVTRQHADALKGVQADLAAAHKVIAKQTELLKALGDRLAEQGDMLKALREAPAGRKSAAANPAAGGKTDMDGEQIMAKALSAQKAGHLSALDVASIEARLTSRVPLKPHHLAAIQAA